MQNKAQQNKGFKALGLTSDCNTGAIAPMKPMWMHHKRCWHMRSHSDEGEGVSWTLNAF